MYVTTGISLFALDVFKKSVLIVNNCNMVSGCSGRWRWFRHSFLLCCSSRCRESLCSWSVEHSTAVWGTR